MDAFSPRNSKSYLKRLSYINRHIKMVKHPNANITQVSQIAANNTDILQSEMETSIMHDMEGTQGQPFNIRYAGSFHLDTESNIDNQPVVKRKRITQAKQKNVLKHIEKKRASKGKITVKRKFRFQILLDNLNTKGKKCRVKLFNVALVSDGSNEVLSEEEIDKLTPMLDTIIQDIVKQVKKEIQHENQTEQVSGTQFHLLATKANSQDVKQIEENPSMQICVGQNVACKSDDLGQNMSTAEVTVEINDNEEATYAPQFHSNDPESTRRFNICKPMTETYKGSNNVIPNVSNINHKFRNQIGGNPRVNTLESNQNHGLKYNVQPSWKVSEGSINPTVNYRSKDYNSTDESNHRQHFPQNYSENSFSQNTQQNVFLQQHQDEQQQRLQHLSLNQRRNAAVNQIDQQHIQHDLANMQQNIQFQQQGRQMQTELKRQYLQQCLQQHIQKQRHLQSRQQQNNQPEQLEDHVNHQGQYHQNQQFQPQEIDEFPNSRQMQRRGNQSPPQQFQIQGNFDQFSNRQMQRRGNQSQAQQFQEHDDKILYQQTLQQENQVNQRIQAGQLLQGETQTNQLQHRQMHINLDKQSTQFSQQHIQPPGQIQLQGIPQQNAQPIHSKYARKELQQFNQGEPKQQSQLSRQPSSQIPVPVYQTHQRHNNHIQKMNNMKNTKQEQNWQYNRHNSEPNVYHIESYIANQEPLNQPPNQNHPQLHDHLNSNFNYNLKNSARSMPNNAHQTRPSNSKEFQPKLMTKLQLPSNSEPRRIIKIPNGLYCTTQNYDGSVRETQTELSHTVYRSLPQPQDLDDCPELEDLNTITIDYTQQELEQPNLNNCEFINKNKVRACNVKDIPNQGGTRNIAFTSNNHSKLNKSLHKSQVLERAAARYNRTSRENAQSSMGNFNNHQLRHPKSKRPIVLNPSRPPKNESTIFQSDTLADVEQSDNEEFLETSTYGLLQVSDFSPVIAKKKSNFCFPSDLRKQSQIRKKIAIADVKTRNMKKTRHSVSFDEYYDEDTYSCSQIYPVYNDEDVSDHDGVISEWMASCIPAEYTGGKPILHINDYTDLELVSDHLDSEYSGLTKSHENVFIEKLSEDDDIEDFYSKQLPYLTLEDIQILGNNKRR